MALNPSSTNSNKVNKDIPRNKPIWPPEKTKIFD